MKLPNWNRKSPVNGDDEVETPLAADFFGDMVAETRKSRGKKARDIGAVNVTELQEALARAEALIETYQLQLAELRERMQGLHRRSIVKGLTTETTSAISITHGEADEEAVHTFLEVSEAESEMVETVRLPSEFASPVFYDEWEKFEDADAVSDYVLTELGAVDGTNGAETGECPGTGALDAGADGLRDDIERMKMQYEVVKRLSVDREEAFGAEAERLETELANARTDAAEADALAARLKLEAARNDTERKKLYREIETRDAEIRRLRKELDEALTPGEIGIAAESHSGEQAPVRDSDYEKMKNDLIETMRTEPTMEAVFALRRLFLSAKQWEDGIAVFRKMMSNPRNNRFLPAICLVVGEMFKLAGRAEEANFYLTNPLIKHDSFAQHLLRNMKL